MVLALRVLFYLVSVTFIVIVLIQPDRSHGMSGSGGGANSLFGVAQDGRGNTRPHPEHDG